MAERLPARFGRYMLDEQIGAGGMAEVFRARLIGQGAGQGVEKVVCVKRILPHLSKRPEFVAMFKDEAKLMSGLQHEHIVQIYDSGEVDGALYLAMELVEGCSLATVLEQQSAKGERLSMPQALTIAVALAKALHHAHTATRDGKPLHLVHRDVSPHNVLLGAARQVKLADFGVAHAEDRLARTETGALKGKLQYASPEQVRADALDRRSDQFAFGAVLWEMLTGRRLFEGKSELAVMDAVLKGRVAPPSSLRADVPRALDDVVLRMLARDADQRFHDMGEVAELLSELLFAMRAPPSETDIKPLVDAALKAWRASRPRDPSRARPAALGDAEASAKTASRLEAARPAFKPVPMVAADEPKGAGRAGLFAAGGALVVVIGVVVAVVASPAKPSRVDADAGVSSSGGASSGASSDPTGASRAPTDAPARDIALPPMRRLVGIPLEERCTTPPTAFAHAAPQDGDALLVLLVESAGESVQSLTVPVLRSGRTRVAVASPRPLEVTVRPGPGADVPQVVLVGPLTGRVDGNDAATIERVGGVLSEFPDRTGLQEHATTLRRVQGAAGVPTTLLVRARTCSALGIGDLDLAAAVGDDVLAEDAWRTLSRDVDRARVPPPACDSQCGPDVRSATARDVVTQAEAARLRGTIAGCLACVDHAR